MRNRDDFQDGAPSRQGFYEVLLQDETTTIAEWRQRDKRIGKTWWEHRSEHPSIAKTPQPLTRVKGYRKASAQAIEQALHRELTEAEQVEVAYRKLRGSNLDRLAVRMPVVERRRLRLGMAVTFGALPECVVVGLHEDDEYVTIRYRNLKRESGQMVGAGFEYLTSHWLEVFETAAEKGTSVCRPSLLERTVFSNGDLLGLVSRVGHFGVDDSPDYQRGYAWTADDKDRYLDSLFCGRDLGRFIFVNYGYTRPAEVFDGKQRLSTLMELVQSRRAYKGIYWHEMLKRERRHVESRVVQVAEVPASKASRAELLQMFLDVNAAGVPQTEEHLNHVRRLLEAEQRNASAN